MKLEINTFKGVVPKPENRLLPVEVATLARNCRFDRGVIEPYANTEYKSDLPANTKSLFRYGDKWFTWTKDVNAVNSPINQDDWGRVYFTGDGEPKVTYNTIATVGTNYPSASHKLGIPQPESGPSILSLPVTQDDEGFANDQTRFYVYTYVSELGEEGAPSLPSAEVTILNPETDTVGLNFPSTVPVGHNITHIRLYRSVTGSSSSGFYQVSDIPISAKDTMFTDNLTDDYLGVDLASSTYDVPPENMQGLVSLPGGFLAGFSGNSICFCEAYQPHAWPVGYRQTTESDIVGMAVFGNSVFVATETKPYIFSGTTPDGMAGQKLEINQACVAKRSIVDMGDYVFYASPEGIVAASSSSVDVITKNVIRKDQWNELYEPETIHAYQFEDKYLAFHSGNAAFIYDPANGAFVDVDLYADAGFNILKQDALNLVVNNKLVVWDESNSSMTHRWRKRFELNKKILPRAVRIEVDGTPDFTFNLLVDGVNTFQITNPTKEVFRLPPGRGEYFEIEVSGTSAIKRIVLASSQREL